MRVGRDQASLPVFSLEVSAQVAALGEGLLAYVASVGSLAGVPAEVVSEVARLLEN